MRALLFLCLISFAYATIHNDPMPRPSMERFKQESNEKVKRHSNYLHSYDTDRKIVYLTFDDGPDKEVTPGFLTLLKQEGVLANFFFLGENIVRYPEVVRHVHASGHRVLSHAYHHQLLTKLDTKTMMKEQIVRTQKIIEAQTGGVSYPMMRPPYGAMTDEQITAMKKAGFEVVIWSIDTFDWMSQQTPLGIADEVKKYLHPGAIILMHSGASNKKSLKGLSYVIRTIRDAGYDFGLLGDVPPARQEQQGETE